MNMYEQLLYLLRIPFLLLCAIVVAVIFNFTTPSLSHVDLPGEEESGIGPLRADAYAAVIAYHKQLYTEPGVISAQEFTQENADMRMHTDSDEPPMYAAQAVVRDMSGEALTDAIIYNTPAYTVLETIAEFGSVAQKTKLLPIVLEQGNQRVSAVLQIEVYYEP